jgi:hypothetical protein
VVQVGDGNSSRDQPPINAAQAARPLSSACLARQSPEELGHLDRIRGAILDTLPYPPTIEQMRQAMIIAQTAWNLPIVEDEPGGEGAGMRALVRATDDLGAALRRQREDVEEAGGFVVAGSA